MLLVTVTTQSNRRYYVKWRDILHHHWCTQRVLAGPSHPWMPRTNYIYHTLWPVYVLPCTLWHLLHFGALQPPMRPWSASRTFEACQECTTTVPTEKDFSQVREIHVHSVQSEVQWLYCGPDGFAADPSLAKAIAEFQRPTNITNCAHLSN